MVVGEAQLATFAGGCFWCMEPPFEKIDGVGAVISGYSGGRTENPTYEQVSSGIGGHAEVIQVHFDPTRVSYDDLLQVFWRQIDPTDAERAALRMTSKRESRSRTGRRTARGSGASRLP